MNTNTFWTTIPGARHITNHIAVPIITGINIDTVIRTDIRAPLLTVPLPAPALLLARNPIAPAPPWPPYPLRSSPAAARGCTSSCPYRLLPVGQRKNVPSVQPTVPPVQNVVNQRRDNQPPTEQFFLRRLQILPPINVQSPPPDPTFIFSI